MIYVYGIVVIAVFSFVEHRVHGNGDSVMDNLIYITAMLKKGKK
jgi:hypothetical protein